MILLSTLLLRVFILFDLALGERAGIPRKPAPDAVLEILARLDTDKADAVYIGDSDVDIMTAQNAGIPCISVAWGFKGKKFLEEQQAEMIIEKPSEIQKYL